MARSAVMASDLVLVPVQPSPYDVWAAKEIIDLFNEAVVYRPDLQKAFVINRKIVKYGDRTRRSRGLSDYPIPVLEIGDLPTVAFAESATQGLTVYDLDPDMLAARKWISLAEEIERLFYDQEGQLRCQASNTSAGRQRRRLGREPRGLPTSEPTKRLTIDVPLSLHKRIKSQCAMQNLVMADEIRELLERRFPAMPRSRRRCHREYDSSQIRFSGSTANRRRDSRA